VKTPAWLFAAAVVAFVGPCAASSPLPQELPAKGTVQAAFPPWDDAESMIVSAIRRAKRQVLVQAYSFTSRSIANALVAAHRRGIDVRVIADREQSAFEGSRLRDLVRAGIPVLVDAASQSAHSKVMLLDAGSAGAAVITGSYNWTYAAQYRNAENVLIVRGHPELAQAYLENWERHAANASFLGAPQ
jgi:phosphatidylserine/phosphatidylglycerophosphate/cardiolipin synthase-like enzyme